MRLHEDEVDEASEEQAESLHYDYLTIVGEHKYHTRFPEYLYDVPIVVVHVVLKVEVTPTLDETEGLKLIISITLPQYVQEY